MENSFSLFARPFLLQPELWYDIIPDVSYGDLIRLFVAAKFVDLSNALSNFNVAKRIWCRKVSLVSFIDTLSHACINNADAAFFSIIGTRYDTERKDKFKDDLLKWVDTTSDKHDDIEKVAMIAIKLGYVDVLEKCLSIDNFLDIVRLTSLLFHASSFKEGPQALRSLLPKIKALPEDQLYYIAGSWINLPITEEKSALEKVLTNVFDEETIFKILHDACQNKCRVEDTPDNDADVIDLNTRIIINCLNFAKDFSNYPFLWTEALGSTSNQEARALRILKEMPIPVKLTPKHVKDALKNVPEANRLEIFLKFIEYIDPASLASAFYIALKNGQKEVVSSIFNRIKNEINISSPAIIDGLSRVYSQCCRSSTTKTEAAIQFNMRMKDCILLILKNAYITQETLSKVSFCFAAPHDLQWSDFNLFSSFKTLKSDPEGNHLLSIDTNNRIYVCPPKKSFSARVIELLIMEPVIFTAAIMTVVEQAFKLLNAIYTKNPTKIKASLVGITVTPLAYLGMEIALLTHFIFPEKSSKLYHACAMCINVYVSSFLSSFQILPSKPNFLHRPISFDYT